MKRNRLKSIVCLALAVATSAVLSGSVLIDAKATSNTVGDANCDGSVTISDATYVGQFLNGVFTVSNLNPLDANANNVISQTDMYRILEIYAQNGAGM